ncbi:Plant self-incompatibility S1 [Dillenia turbinata]|uniref:S-protein homolog n=1 Tax=Dillenia turbinata TaxID=194707 RepID=A0AAN8W5C1_9MAGN
MEEPGWTYPGDGGRGGRLEVMRVVDSSPLTVVMGGCPSQAGVFEQTHVQIQNGLDEGVELSVHCKSKNDDLGFHDLPFQADHTFSFRPNFWGTTLFYCSFKWGSEFKHFKWGSEFCSFK